MPMYIAVVSYTVANSGANIAPDDSNDVVTVPAAFVVVVVTIVVAT